MVWTSHPNTLVRIRKSTLTTDTIIQNEVWGLGDEPGANVTKSSLIPLISNTNTVASGRADLSSTHNCEDKCSL